MSRIGKHPVAIPQGVEVQLSGQTLTVKGRLGALTASEIISHIGPRPETSLAELAAPLLP